MKIARARSCEFACQSRTRGVASGPWRTARFAEASGQGRPKPTSLRRCSLCISRAATNAGALEKSYCVTSARRTLRAVFSKLFSNRGTRRPRTASGEVHCAKRARSMATSKCSARSHHHAMIPLIALHLGRAAASARKLLFEKSGKSFFMVPQRNFVASPFVRFLSAHSKLGVSCPSKVLVRKRARSRSF